jgi:hypothetical protein
LPKPFFPAGALLFVVPKASGIPWDQGTGSGGGLSEEQRGRDVKLTTQFKVVFKLKLDGFTHDPYSFVACVEAM